MFGTLRFFLACLVVAYHLSYKPLGLLIGISAVTVFYMISGYVISGLYTTKFIKISNARHFYADRFIRIAPQYYFYLLMTILVFYVPWGDASSTKDLSLLNLASNLALIPLGLQIYLPTFLDPMTTIFPLVNPTWSLANEFIFYLLAPFVLVIPFITLSALLISLAVFCLASHGMISIYQFSYWVLPGPLVFFLLGHFIYQKKWIYLASTLVILSINLWHLIALGRVAVFSGIEAEGMNLDIYVGLYCGFILLLALKNLKPNAIDNWLGSISYGVFLCHFLVFPVVPFLPIGTTYLPIIAVLILSSCLGAFSYHCVEKPIRKYYRQRLSIRERSKAETTTERLAMPKTGIKLA